LNLSNFESDRK